MDKFTKPRETRVGKLTEAARERLQAAINGELSHKINGTIKAKDVRESIENSRKFGNGISPDLISDFLSPSPSADRKFTKAKILFDCLGLSLTEGSDDWIPKQQATARSSTPSSPSMDWLDRCQTLLADRRLTSNALGLGETRSLDAIHVPLGLMERKQQPRVEREPDPAMGSQLYQQPELREVKRFEHEAFLKDVVQDRACGKHIAILASQERARRHC